jgi:periplasmic divalent cation tolerance protein
VKRTTRHLLVLVTAPDLPTARKLARLALTARLVACANLLPRLESHYWWQGKLESSAEVLMVMKTTRPRLAALERLILAEHPYDTAEFVVLPIQTGSAKYLDWITASVAGKK